MKCFGLFLMLSAFAASAFAGVVTTPEIDGNSAASAVALLAGGALVLRSRRKK